MKTTKSKKSSKYHRLKYSDPASTATQLRTFFYTKLQGGMAEYGGTISASPLCWRERLALEHIQNNLKRILLNQDCGNSSKSSITDFRKITES